MLETRSPSKTFSAVRFVLFGFDSVHERDVRAKLLSGGGVDAGQYSQICTHVIVDKIVYDDPLCVAARNDRKTLVTALWVYHSYDIGLPVDATSIMYRPLRDLNGIPGAKGLIMCLTGYQRQDRDDIMAMVRLMGAQFSKPLVANKVTHLLCYKFEGEKYELANKLKRIKLVNHRWLEDCLRDWELLPEDNYSKSGYELEMMEAEAKDSEEDAEDTTVKQSSREMANTTPRLKIGTPEPCQLPKSTGELPKMLHNLSEPEGLPSAVNVKDMYLTPGRKNRADHASGFDSNCVSKVSARLVTNTFNDATSVGLPDPQERTPKSTKGGSDLESISRSAEKPRSDAKFCALSYTRNTPRKSPSSVFSRESGNIKGSPKVQLGESINTPSAKMEYAKDLNGSAAAEYPPKGSELLYEEASNIKKQKIDVSCSNTKSQNTCHDAQASVKGSPLVSCNQGLEVEPASLLDGQSKINNHSPIGNQDHSGDDIVSLEPAQKSHTDASTGKSSKFKKKPFAQGPLLFENAAPETAQNESYNKNTPQTSFKGLRRSSLAGKPEDKDFGAEKSEQLVADAGLSQYQHQDKQVPSPYERKSETAKSQTIANLEEIREGNKNLIMKQGRTKMMTKKTLGSRPKLKSTANQKGSIYLNTAAAQIDPSTSLSGEMEDHEKISNANELETSPETFNDTAVKEVEKTNCSKSGYDMEMETNLMDDETEAPDDKDVLHEEKNDAAGSMEDSAKEEKNAAQLQQKGESTSKGNSMKGKVSKRKRQPSGKTKKKTTPPVLKEAQSMKVLDGEETCDGKNVEEEAMEKDNGKPCYASKTKRTIAGKKPESSMESEKENKPIVGGGKNIRQAKDHVGKTAVKSDKVSMKIKRKSRKNNPNYTPVTEVSKQVKTEPVWFILSGHRLQRKEFQQVIRRLKGKVCRDSHQWSYQATHFIAPDPIRRTEKFFAAAASGRWILNTDYLTACSQAGRFLDEEPYEWHKNGLSEDGAINLEAPRKWRLLREKTGHGAFYGMRIIIYGECIAPPLDTLKRVVKAGDGTILATSPPYTRFLTSGVDYAIVSPGMPRVDLWVQEFLRHEIPCIVADYLVEYVCKPGYSLERHVLYNTNPWAEKSYANLLSRAEEIVEELTPSDNFSSNDIACQVCGSRDRGDVMLICGDESGSSGCGIGMHIDCCDPPLENIPEEDWFCSNCSGGSNSNNSPKKRRKGTSSRKT